MTPFVPFPGGAMGEIVYEFNRSKILSNRLWFRFDNPPITQADLDGLAFGLYHWHNDNILPFLSNQITFAAVKVYDWSADPPPLISGAGLSELGGTIDLVHSANVALRVNFRWPLGVRERMNCNFVPGVPMGGVDLNTPIDPFLDGIWEGYAALVDAARLFPPVFNWRWVVASSYDAGALRSSLFNRECNGPVQKEFIRLGQRRKRLN